MALPKLDTPVYELEQPSTGEKIKYRPFLVKEQKTLMMAQESEDDKQIREALGSLISNCTFESIDPYKVPIFDIEFLFLRIRGKSVGEKIDLSLLCPDDNETRVNKSIDLEEIDVNMKVGHTNEIDITDKEFIRSIGFLDECVKSILYRDMGYDHPLSGLIKHIVEATKSKNGKEIATRFNTPTVAEIIDYLEGGEDE